MIWVWSHARGDSVDSADATERSAQKSTGKIRGKLSLPIRFSKVIYLAVN